MLTGLKNYAKGVGGNSILQSVVDYGGAGLVGAGAQQLTNMVTGGADPNPLLSGALAAPALVGMGRFGRGMYANRGSEMYDMNRNSFVYQRTNPISQAALTGSAASLLGGGTTNLYNTFAGGTDYDPNYAAASLALLGGIAPLTMKVVGMGKG
jgi:hypothetical protein